MEALQEAYRQIQTYENPDERHYLSLEGGWKHSRPTSPSSFPHAPSTTETGPTESCCQQEEELLLDSPLVSV